MSGKFIVIKCKKCRNSQHTFSKPSMKVKCLVCGNILMKSTGGCGKVVKENIIIEESAFRRKDIEKGEPESC